MFFPLIKNKNSSKWCFRFLDRGGGSVVVCDINRSMLGVGEDRARARGISEDRIQWTEGDAQVSHCSTRASWTLPQPSAVHI